VEPSLFDTETFHHPGVDDHKGGVVAFVDQEAVKYTTFIYGLPLYCIVARIIIVNIVG
jgi:hypothetical protein